MMHHKHHSIAHKGLSLVLAVALPLTSIACSPIEDEAGELSLLRSAEEMLLSNTHTITFDPDVPTVVDASLTPALASFVSPFLADGEVTSDPLDIFAAETIEVQGADGTPLQLERVNQSLRIVGTSADVGVGWSLDFSQVVFRTPHGEVEWALQGTLLERRKLASVIALLGLTGDAPPNEAAALAFNAGAIAAGLGLIAVTYLVICMAYTQTCQQRAANTCAPYGVLSVEAVCGGMKVSFGSGQGGPQFGFELGVMECRIQCNAPSHGGDGDGGDDGGEGGGSIPPHQPPGFPQPDPDWSEVENPCPPGQVVAPCIYSETTYDESGDILEVTVTAEQFGYCCVDE